MLGILPLLLVCNTVWSDTTTAIWLVERLTGNEYLELHGGDYSVENDETEVATQGFPGGQVEPDSIVGNPPPNPVCTQIDTRGLSTDRYARRRYIHFPSSELPLQRTV